MALSMQKSNERLLNLIELLKIETPKIRSMNGEIWFEHKYIKRLLPQESSQTIRNMLARLVNSKIIKKAKVRAGYPTIYRVIDLDGKLIGIDVSKARPKFNTILHKMW